MADTATPTTPANTIANTPSEPIAPTNILQGTDIPVPTGTGVETLRSIKPPFRSNGPAWYTPPDAAGKQSIWSILGCACPQPGRYLQTENGVIHDLVTLVSRHLFYAMWHFKDRQFNRFPSRDFLWQIHQMLTVGRARLAAVTVPSAGSPLTPTHATPTYEMFLVNPVPLYGTLGSPNTWIRRMAETVMLMQSEAMQHADNQLAFYVTSDFAGAVYPYIKWLLVGMATKFFGYDVPTASVDTFVIDDAHWQAYDPTKFSVSTEATSSRYPPGYDPTDLDLEPIRDLPIEQVIPYLQPWPDAQLKYSSGGIWANPGPPSSVNTTSPAAGGIAAAVAGIAAVLPKSGPPS
jgi:hypothetical protein